MTDLQYFCPQCCGNEVRVERPVLLGTGPGHAQCPLCGWQGSADDVLATPTPDHKTFWDGERVANLLIYAATHHAAGPLVQALEVVGLVPRVTGSEEEQRSALFVRAGVLKAVLEAVVVAGFEAAAKLSPSHFERFDPARAEESRRIFRYGEPYHEH